MIPKMPANTIALGKASPKKAGVVAGVSYLDVIFSLILGLFLGDAFPSAMVFARFLAK